MSAERRAGTFRSALSHRDYRFLLTGLTVSETGNWLYSAASIIFILRVTGAPAWVAVAGVVRLIPFLLFEPLGGAIADRYDRRRVMIASDLIRAGLMMVIAVISTRETTGAVIGLIALTFVNNTVSAPYFPAVTALTPSIVPEDDLAAANALSGTIDNFATAFGPALSALLLLLGPPPIAFAVNALTFLFSAAMVWAVGIRGKVGEVEVEAGLMQRVKDGMAAIRRSKEAALLVGVMMGFALTFGQETVLFGPIAEKFLGIGVNATGLLFAAPGVGGILATTAAARLAGRRHTSAILVVSVLIAGIPLTTLSVVHLPAAAYLLLAVEGAAVIIADVVATTTLQRVVPMERIGSVFGIVGGATVAATAVGAIIAPITIAWFGLAWATALAGSVLIVITLAALPRARSMDRLAAARAEELAPFVAILRRASIFEPASPPQLEALAAVATAETVPSGSVLMREGDEPDDLFVIDDGEFAVTTAAEGGPIATLVRGDVVGEIGLVRHRPRTATVAATTDAEVLRIPGEDFLAIITEGPRVSTTVQAVIEHRLSGSGHGNEHPDDQG